MSPAEMMADKSDPVKFLHNFPIDQVSYSITA